MSQEGKEGKVSSHIPLIIRWIGEVVHNIDQIDKTLSWQEKKAMFEKASQDYDEGASLEEFILWFESEPDRPRD